MKIKMATQAQEKKKLSKSILEMKFMKRSKEKFCKEQDEEEGKAMFASELTEAMQIKGSKFVIEQSFVPCEGLIMGRLSYHGMNPEIEKLLELERNPKKEPEEDQNDMEISDMEMARRYSTLIGTIGNKFKTKSRKRFEAESGPRKRAKFMKPGHDSNNVTV